LSGIGDVYGKAKGELRFSEKVEAKVPGFKGYKEKELRRESDRLVRNTIVQKLNKARSDTKEVFQALSDQKLSEALTRMDRLVMVFDRVVEKVNHASYGYAGFFDVVKIKEDALSRMIAFDNGLIGYADAVSQQAATFRKEVTDGKFEDALEQIKKISESLSSLEDTFDSRKEAIMEV
jgi:predicted translin family RNA/ssDNA-binding protein